MNAPENASYEHIERIDRLCNELFIFDREATGWVPRYGNVVLGERFKGSAGSLAATVCEGLYETGFPGGSLYLSGVRAADGKEHIIGVALLDGNFYEIGDVSQGGYVNSFGRPYRKPRDIVNTSYEILWMYSFIDQDVVEIPQEIGAGTMGEESAVSQEPLSWGVVHDTDARAPDASKNPFVRFWRYVCGLLKSM